MCYLSLFVIGCVVIFFFFKQKTAYEMRISDWSSDVCSSDLTVPLVISQDLKVSLPRSDRDGMQVAVVYDGPIPAPIAAGQEIAKLRVTWPDGMPVEVPLTAGTEVEQLGAFGRIFASIKFLLLGSP